MDENLQKENLISSVQAAELFGVTNDYITLLCRQRKIGGMLMANRLWLVDRDDLEQYFAHIKQKQEIRNQELSSQLKRSHAIALPTEQWVFSIRTFAIPLVALLFATGAAASGTMLDDFKDTLVAAVGGITTPETVQPQSTGGYFPTAVTQSNGVQLMSRGEVGRVEFEDRLLALTSFVVEFNKATNRPIFLGGRSSGGTVNNVTNITNITGSGSSNFGQTFEISSGALVPTTTLGIIVASSTIAGNLTVVGTMRVASLASCDTIDTDSNGNFSCGTDQTATGAANAFSFATNFGVLSAATSSPLWAQAGLFASSTSRIGSTTFAINGNVGIGTSTPPDKLTIQNTSATSQNLLSFYTADGMRAGGFSVSNDFQNVFQWANNGGNSYNFSVGGNGNVSGALFQAGDTGSLSSLGFSFAEDPDTGLYIPSTNANVLGFVTGGAERARLTTTAFGIGTTSPFANLSIHANNGDTNKTLFAIGSSTANSTTTLFVVTNTGNVGIGSSTPDTKLSVTGVSTFTSSASQSYDWTIADKPDSALMRVGLDTNGNGIMINGPTGGAANVYLGVYNQHGTTLFDVNNSGINLGGAAFVNRLFGGSSVNFNNVPDYSMFSSDIVASPAALFVDDRDGPGRPERATPLVRFAFNDSPLLSESTGGINALNGTTTGSRGLAFYSYSTTTGTFVENIRILGTGNTGIASTSPFATLSVHAQNGASSPVLFAIGSSTANSTSTLFSINNTGVVNFNPAQQTGDIVATLAGTTFLSASSTGLNTSLGINALSGTTGGSNSAFGSNALLSNTTGISNSAFGSQAMQGNTIGIHNSAFGAVSLISNTSGTDNSAFGYFALVNNSTGDRNAAFGYHSFSANRTGSNNAGLGYFTSGNNMSATNTVAVGYQAGAGVAAYNAQGYTILGYNAGANITTGADYNTLLGYQTGNSLSSGAYNIALGQNVDLPSNTGNQQLNIGNVLFGSNIYNGSSLSSAPVVNGSIGIGTSSPFATFGIHANNGSTNTTLFAIGSSTATATTTLFSINNAGRVGIGTTSPVSALTVLGGISSPSANGISNEVFGQGATVAAGNSYNTVIGYGATQNAGFAATYSTVIGAFATSSHNSNVVIGAASKGEGGNSVTIGAGLTNTAFDSVLIGTGGAISNNGLIAIGDGAQASAQGAMAFGWGVGADSAGQIVFGSRAVASNTPSLILAGSTDQYTGANLFKLGTQWIDSTDATRKGRVSFSTYDTAVREFMRADTTGSSVTTQFLGGNVGIGTTSPFAKLSISANNGDTNTTLFAIASSTASATTTLFSINNTGVVNFNPARQPGDIVATLAGTTFMTASSTGDNTSFGLGSLISITSGSGNAAFGSRAGDQITTGFGNFALGVDALGGATTANFNTAIGVTAQFAGNGSFNTSIGYRANYSTSGHFNTAIGYGTLSSDNGQDLSGSDNVGLGFAALQAQRFGSRSIGIGSSALYSNTAATNTIAIGFEAGFGQVDTRYGNQGALLVGYRAGFANTTGSDYNTLLGYQAGDSITTGAGNLIIGANVAAPSISGNNQLNIGNLIYGTNVYSSSGSSPATSSAPVLNGTIGIGTTSPSNKLHVSNTTGASQLRFDDNDSGNGGGYLTSAGPSNFFMSAGAEWNGSQWVARSTGASVIGGGAAAAGQLNFYTNTSLTAGNQFNVTERMRISAAGGLSFGDAYVTTDPGANNAIFAGSIGISTSSPFATLSVHANNGSTNKTLFAIGSSTASATTTLFSVSNAGTFKLSAGLGTGTGGNYLCIDTTTFEVLRGNGVSCTASSLKFKDNVHDLSYGLNEVMALRPVSYTYKPETNMGKGVKLGFIAEEVEKLLPEVVSYDKEGNVFGLDYPVLTSVLTKAIQELNLNLQTIASTTASSTPQSQSFAESFFNNIFARITTWFADASNGIGDFFAGRVHTKEICVGESGDETCISKQQLDSLLANTASAGSNSNPEPTPPAPQVEPPTESEASSTPPIVEQPTEPTVVLEPPVLDSTNTPQE